MGGLSVVFVAIFLIFCDPTLGQTFCARYDFNRTVNVEFSLCSGKNPLGFELQSYASHPELHPFRQSSHYFLTNIFVNELLCIQSNTIFSFTPNTTIDAAVFLKAVGNSFIRIDVYDADRIDFNVASFRNDGTNGWYILHGAIHNNVQRARVEISGNINAQSLLAIEYLNILNSAVHTPDCTNQQPPTATTTRPILPITPPHPPTNPPPHNNEQIWWWVIISICLAILLIVIICVGVYCIIDNRRSRSHSIDK